MQLKMLVNSFGALIDQLLIKMDYYFLFPLTQIQFLAVQKSVKKAVKIRDRAPAFLVYKL